jgi:hypothetical protein
MLGVLMSLHYLKRKERQTVLATAEAESDQMLVEPVPFLQRGAAGLTP